MLLLLVAVAAPAATLDEDFLAAREAYRAGQGAKVAAYAKRFKGHAFPTSPTWPTGS